MLPGSARRAGVKRDRRQPQPLRALSSNGISVSRLLKEKDTARTKRAQRWVE